MDKLWKAFEREVGTNLFEGSKRNMGSGAVNRKDNGEHRTGDIIHDRYQVECKCYQKIALFNMWSTMYAKTAKAYAEGNVVMCFENSGTVVVHQDLFIRLRRAFERYLLPDAVEVKALPFTCEFDFYPKRLGVLSWWDKVCKEAEAEKKIPLLAMRQMGNRKRTLVMMSKDTYVKMSSCLYALLYSSSEGGNLHGQGTNRATDRRTGTESRR